MEAHTGVVNRHPVLHLGSVVLTRLTNSPQSGVLLLRPDEVNAHWCRIPGARLTRDNVGVQRQLAVFVVVLVLVLKVYLYVRITDISPISVVARTSRSGLDGEVFARLNAADDVLSGSVLLN